MCYSLWYHDPRCCRPVAWKLPLPGYWPATSWVHYTASCNTQSSAPEDGQNNCPKHVELIGIINKPLLLQQVGCLYYLYQWCAFKQISHFKITGDIAVVIKCYDFISISTWIHCITALVLRSASSSFSDFHSMRHGAVSPWVCSGISATMTIRLQLMSSTKMY